jgi:hypothetical protein
MSRVRERSPIRITVRTVQIALGVLWIGDGLLQLQPSMFTTAFAHQVLAPSAAGQPAVVAWPVHEFAQLVSRQPFAFNAVFATAQLLIGIGLLSRSTVKPALVLSMAWVAGVWALGEGFGMLFTGSASPLTGAPGGVLLYGIIGVVAWPRRDASTLDPDGSAASGGILGETGARVAWAVLWVASAALWLLPDNRKGGAVAAQIAGAGPDGPVWLAHLDRTVAHSLSGVGTGLAVTLAVASLVIGLGPLFARRPTAFLVAGVALSLDFWLLGQSLGGLTSGMATDPNAAPLFCLLALALFPNHPAAALAGPAPTWEPAAVPVPGGAFPDGSPVLASVGATPISPPGMRP